MKGESFLWCIFGDLKIVYYYLCIGYNGVIDEYEVNEMWVKEYVVCKFELIKS